MAINTNRVSVALGTSSAPLIEGITPTSFGTYGLGVGFDSTATSSRVGCRVALTATTDFTTHPFVSFQLYGTDPYSLTVLAPLASGGRRVIFVDTSGNYAGFNVWGGDIPGWLTDAGRRSYDLFPEQFVNIGDIRNPTFYISPGRTPDISSVTPVDWSQIAAIEINQARDSGSSVQRLSIGSVRKSNTYIATGTESFAAINTVALADTSDRNYLRRSPRNLESIPGVAYNCNLSLQLGDGVTSTTFSDSQFLLGFFVTYDQVPAFRSTGPLLQLNDANTGRGFYINQSATDVVTLTDGAIASAAWWEWEVTGSTAGTVTCTRVQFWRYSKFVAGHGQYIDCQFNGSLAPVEVNGTSVILNGAIRDATTTALKVNTGPAIYDELSLRFNNPTATADIELGSGGAGTYELPNIEVPAGYTLKIRNNSATNAITVEIPLGITFSTSTAGGSITVTTPSVLLDGVITNIFAGSRLQVFNVTTNTEVYNDIVAGTTYTISYTEGTTFSSGDTIRIRLARCTGATASIGYEGFALANADGFSLFAAQADDAAYNANGIDGTTVTEFTFDYPNIQVDINDADGATTITRLYAWWANERTTADGIRTLIGGLIAEDAANYKINTSVVDLKLDNTSSTGVIFTGDLRLYRDDGLAPVVSSTTGGGSITLYAGKVYTVAVGSGVTAQDKVDIAAAVLTAAQTSPIHADTKKMNGADVLGTGIPADLWRGS